MILIITHFYAFIISFSKIAHGIITGIIMIELYTRIPKKIKNAVLIGTALLLMGNVECNSNEADSSNNINSIETFDEKIVSETSSVKSPDAVKINDSDETFDKDITKKRLFVYIVDESTSFNPNPKNEGQMKRWGYTTGTKKINLFDAAFEHLIENIDREITYGDQVDIIRIISENKEQESSITNFSFANSSYVYDKPSPEDNNTLRLAQWRQSKERFEQEIRPKFDKKKKYQIDFLRDYKNNKLGVGTSKTDLWGSIRDASHTLDDDRFAEKYLIIYSDLDNDVYKESKGIDDIILKNVNVTCLFFNNENNSTKFRTQRAKEIKDKTNANNVTIQTVKQSYSEVENLDNITRY